MPGRLPAPRARSPSHRHRVNWQCDPRRHGGPSCAPGRRPERGSRLDRSAPITRPQPTPDEATPSSTFGLISGCLFIFVIVLYAKTYSFERSTAFQMSWLADLPEIVGFFSYSREDDDAFEGTLSALREAIQRELAAQLGRSKANFRLWQDQAAIAPGKLWESEIETAVGAAVFFIPIVTPRAVSSHYCKFEFEAFLAREHALGRTDLVFPLLYISVPALENEARWREDPVLLIIGSRQYVDWRVFRHRDVHDRVVREAIERFCEKIVQALRKPWLSREERQKQLELEAQRQAEAVRRAQEEKRPAEEDQHRAEATCLAEEEERRAEAGRQSAPETERAQALRLPENEKGHRQGFVGRHPMAGVSIVLGTLLLVAVGVLT